MTLVLIFLNHLEFASAQSYNVHVIVGPGEHKVYSTSFSQNEVGLGWENFISFYIGYNASTEIYFVDTIGYNEFFQNQSLNDISQGNIIRKIHLESPICGVFYNISVVGLQHVYIIIQNSDIMDASWHLIIYPWSIHFLDTVGGKIIVIGGISTIILFALIVLILYGYAELVNPKTILKISFR